MAHMLFFDLISDTRTALAHLLEDPRVSLINTTFLSIAGAWLLLWLLCSLLRRLTSRNSNPRQQQAHIDCHDTTELVENLDTGTPQAQAPARAPITDSLDDLRKTIKMFEAGSMPRSPKVKDVKDMEIVMEFLSASAQGRREHENLKAEYSEHKSNVRFDSDEDEDEDEQVMGDGMIGPSR